MLRTLLIIFGLLLLATAILSAASGGKTVPVKATIRFSEEPWDFGYVPAGVVIYHSYWLYNDDSNDLRILDVRPECGCTAAPLSKKLVPPGDSAELMVSFDTQKMRGNMVKDITIKSDHPVDSNHVIKYFANVKRQHPTIRIAPQIVYFQNMTPKDLRTRRTLELTNQSDREIRVEIVDEPGEYYEVSLSREKVKSGGTCKIDIRLARLPESAEDIGNSLTFTIYTDNAFRITVPIIGAFSK